MRQFDLDRGFTLVEVLVAMALLSILAVGAAALGAAATRAALTARAATSTTALAVQKHEQLRALTWAVTVAGVPVTDGDSDLSGAVPARGGAGTGASPPGALDANLPGFSDYVDVYGRWVGSGAAPPPAAAFARRWSLDHVSGATFVARVVVVPVGRTGVRTGLGAAAALESEAGLISLRTRTTR